MSLGVKNMPTCAENALNKVAKDNAKDKENLVKTAQQNVYIDNVLKSVKNCKK